LASTARGVQLTATLTEIVVAAISAVGVFFLENAYPQIWHVACCHFRQGELLMKNADHNRSNFDQNWRWPERTWFQERLKAVMDEISATQGEIARAPRGANGFGYDPLFFIPPQRKTAAELDPGEKNRISHRGKALAQLLERLRDRRPTNRPN
jgi:hypothetical protein